MFGAHRIYLGKIGSGIAMLLTLGGLGIWWLIDFFISVFGNYTDAEGRVVDRKYTKGITIFLFILLGFGVLFFIGSIILGVMAESMSESYRYR
jgi:TM2 domain-containing membrane protein YozV